MRWIHDKISKAIAEGELEQPDSLVGKKLDLEAYFSTPHHLRVGYSVLAGAGFTPFEVDRLKQMNELEAAIFDEDDEARTEELKAQYNSISVQLNLNHRLF